MFRCPEDYEIMGEFEYNERKTAALVKFQVSLHIYLSLNLLIYLIYIFTYLSSYISTYLSIYISTYLHVYISTYLHIYISTYLNTFILQFISSFIYNIWKELYKNRGPSFFLHILVYIFSSNWHEKIVFSCQFVDALNLLLGCQQNWSKNTIFIM